MVYILYKSSMIQDRQVDVAIRRMNTDYSIFVAIPHSKASRLPQGMTRYPDTPRTGVVPVACVDNG